MPIQLTEAAFEKAKEALAGQPEGTFIRFRALGGGCSGFQHELIFDTSLDEHWDRVEFERDEVRIVVDRKSYLVVGGSTIDYATKGLEAGFAVDNPNAKSSCGCGRSHSI